MADPQVDPMQGSMQGPTLDAGNVFTELHRITNELAQVHGENAAMVAEVSALRQENAILQKDLLKARKPPSANNNAATVAIPGPPIHEEVYESTETGPKVASPDEFGGTCRDTAGHLVVGYIVDDDMTCPRPMLLTTYL